MSGWEYCLLTHVPSGPLIVNITYYTLEGARTKQQRAKSYEEGMNQLWPKMIAELGHEGWELVTVDAGALYFKRPINPDKEDFSTVKAGG